MPYYNSYSTLKISFQEKVGSQARRMYKRIKARICYIITITENSLRARIVLILRFNPELVNTSDWYYTGQCLGSGSARFWLPEYEDLRIRIQGVKYQQKLQNNIFYSLTPNLSL